MHFFNVEILQMAKANPGTPSKHLLADETKKSMPPSLKFTGTAPKLLIASTKYEASDNKF